MQTMHYRQALERISKTQTQMVMVNNEPFEVPLRVPTNGEYVVIDAINFTCSVNSFTSPEMHQIKTKVTELLECDLDLEQEEQLFDIVVSMIKSDLEYIFGEAFTNFIFRPTPIHYYKNAYVVKSEQGEILLNVGIGMREQGATVFFGLTGMGCKLAQDGWEERLHHFLDNLAVDGKITRVDLAHDDFKGAYSSFHWANEKESQDAFLLPKTRNRPACVIHGEFKHNDPYDKGLTLVVGNRKNGKVIRCYEKGKQLGDKSSHWFRSEVEILAKKRLIPFDVLLHPTEFFCGAYPYCLELIELAKKHKGDETPQLVERMPSIKNEANIALGRAIEILKHQFGKYIKVFGEIFTHTDYFGNQTPDYQKVFNKIQTDKHDDYYPKRLRLSSAYFCPDIQDRKLKKQIMDFESKFMLKEHASKEYYQKRQEKIEQDEIQAFYNYLDRVYGKDSHAFIPF